MNDQPPGMAARPRHRGKYARAERERRFLLAEPPDTAEFSSDHDYQTFTLSPRCIHEVTTDPRFTGGQLAHAKRVHHVSVDGGQ